MSDEFTFGGEIVWRPSPDYSDRSHLKRFMAHHGLGSYADLMKRSTADIAWFTDAVIKHLDIRFQKPYQSVVDLSRGKQWPRWCVGGQLNIVQSCVDKHYREPKIALRPALIWEG